MTKVSITYNPYKLTTDITINGEKPKQNSSLNVGKRRLQEWVDKLPDILVNDYPDSIYNIHFTGTQVDFDDLRTSFSINNEIDVSFEFDKKGDAKSVEDAIDKIFNDIKENKYVKELRNKSILDAFENAKNQLFEINVIATVSAGKSTLINALLGKRLMPIGEQATTATIVKIIDKEGQKEFSAEAFDKDNKLVKSFDKVTLEDMLSINDDPSISTVIIEGKIPFVQSVGMKLILVDTPGPNNARDSRHQEMTYKMLENSDKSLVLFVINGRQTGIEDEYKVLDSVRETMENGGKQSRERYIFAVNQMDDFDIDNDAKGVKCIENALDGVIETLKEQGIIEPNIFPLAALPALEYRTKDVRRKTLSGFEYDANRSEIYHFDDYYQYSHLPQSVRRGVETLLSKATENQKIEIHTGIVSIEQAINQYVNKYAKPIKVMHLVQTFKYKLDELNMVEKIQNTINKDQSKRVKILDQIKQIEEKIKTAEKTKKLTQSIDTIDICKEAQKIVAEKINPIRDQINKMIFRQPEKVEISSAESMISSLVSQCKSLEPKLYAKIGSAIEESYQNYFLSIIEEYKRYLGDLGLGIDAGDLSFDPCAFVMEHLKDLSNSANNLINSYTKEKRTKKTEEGEEERPIESNRGRRAVGGGGIGIAGGAGIGAALGSFFPIIGTGIGAAIGALTGALTGAGIGAATGHGKRTVKVKVSNSYVETTNEVKMKELVTSVLQPLLVDLQNIENKVVDHINGQTKKIKDNLTKKLEKIDSILVQKTKSFELKIAEKDATDEEIKQNEERLEWLDSIQKRVDELIEF